MTNRGGIRSAEEVTILRIISTDMSSYRFIGANDIHHFWAVLRVIIVHVT